MTESKRPFYDQKINREREQEYIRRLLKKYRGEVVNDDLKKKVYEDLNRAKAQGHVTIPFRIVLRRDSYEKYPDHIEVILDTKV